MGIRTLARRNSRKLAYVFIGLVFAAGLGLERYDAHRAIRKINDSTVDARIGSCKQYNVQQHKIWAFEKAHDYELAMFIAPLPRTPVGQAQVEADLNITRRLVLGSFPLRNCTPEGIRDYLSTPQGPHAYLPIPKESP